MQRNEQIRVYVVRVFTRKRLVAYKPNPSNSLCIYCGSVLPEELEEIRRVFERLDMPPTIWLVRRCVNPACLRRNVQPVSFQQALGRVKLFEKDR